MPRDNEVDLTNQNMKTNIPHDMQNDDQANQVYPDRGVVQQNFNDPGIPVNNHDRMNMNSTLCPTASEMENNEKILSPRFDAECMKSTGHVTDDNQLQSTVSIN